MGHLPKRRRGLYELERAGVHRADIEPDKGMYLAKWNSYIMALKAYSCQFYYDAAGTTGSILSPAENMAFPGGLCIPPIQSKWRVPWPSSGRPKTGRGGPYI